MIRFIWIPKNDCPGDFFGLLKVGKYSKGGSNPRFLITLATFDEVDVL